MPHIFRLQTSTYYVLEIERFLHLSSQVELNLILKTYLFRFDNLFFATLAFLSHVFLHHGCQVSFQQVEKIDMNNNKQSQQSRSCQSTNIHDPIATHYDHHHHHPSRRSAVFHGLV